MFINWDCWEWITFLPLGLKFVFMLNETMIPHGLQCICTPVKKAGEQVVLLLPDHIAVIWKFGHIWNEEEHSR